VIAYAPAELQESTVTIGVSVFTDAFIANYNETARPFAWKKKKVHQRRFKDRRTTQL